MADFIDSEAEESEEEEELSEKEKKKLKKLKAAQIDSSEEDEEDDEDTMREELKDLIDDNPIEEEDDSSSSSESGEEEGGAKGKRKRDDDLDDRLSEEDFDLIEENLGIKVKRKKTFMRVKRIEDDESDDDSRGKGDDRDAIANELFEGSDGEDDRRDQRDRDRARRSTDHEADQENYSEEEDEDEEDIGDFIVDAEGQPIHGKKKKRKAIYTDAALQEAQEIFGVEFDYDYLQEGEDYDEEDEGEEYEDEEGVRRTQKKAGGKVPKKKSERKTIYEVYEPIDLERGHFTDLDDQIRKTDMPERMQLRAVPISTVEEGSTELEMEAEWIYKYAFSKPTISKQERDGRESAPKSSQTVEKIRKALEFMRCQHLEVPFIGFYRKEYVFPDLNLNDLWRVYKYDEKWTQLQTRKKNMMRLFEKMHKYQSEKLTRNTSDAIPENVRVLGEEDMDRLRTVQSIEELSDVYNHFILYYGADVPAMQEAYRQKQREEARERKSASARKRQTEDGEPMDVDDFGDEAMDLEDADVPDEESTIKQAKRSDLYSICTKAGLDGLLRKYGLTSEQFAENLRDNYQRHEVEQYPTEPHEAAMEYLSPKFPSASEVLKATNYMMAVRIAREPLVRQCVREAFYERATIDVTPTKQGLKEIDENHTLYSVKFLKKKPVRDLSGDQFLRLIIGEQDKLITISFETAIEGATSTSYADEVKQLFQRDEFSKLVQEWNDLRSQVIEIALNKFVFPALVKELKAKLVNEARECVLRACCQQLYDWLKVSPYKVDFPDEEDEWDTKNGIRVMALSYVADLDQAAFGCLVNPDGECTDHIRLEHILKRKNAWKEMDRTGKERDLAMLRNFIFNKKPHVIAVSGESREALMLIEDLRAVVQNLVEDEQWPLIHVELVDNRLAKVFANSTRGENEFREYPHLLREAISIARLMQDPLTEYSQLCNNDEEIMCLKYHPLQDQLSKEELLEGLYMEFVNRTNEVGVDINRAINYPHTANLVQFVCGLGPRKGQALIKILKQNNQRLENRTQLVTACHMGPKVFINCAGFIKIDTNSLGDSTESYVEVLDGSRVHPETYEWARKMAVDALEYDDEDANPAGAVEEILEAPERLKDLDLDAFADELERQGFGNKRITLYDIRSELNHRYKDVRTPYQPPSPEEVFNMLTKESPQTFYIGKLVMAVVTGFQHRKPKREELDRANPNRNEETGLWQCPFCRQNDFHDLADVWNHFDAGACNGQAVGVRIRLDNGLSGFIPLKCLSDSEVTNPEERVRPNQTIHCRITKIDVERFSVMSTSKSSDLMDRNGEWRPPKDLFYDTTAEEAIQRAEEESKKLKNRQSYTKRVIVHPSFKNIGFKDAEKLMANMDQGEVIVRPSSKGVNHLTVMWKVGEGIYQNVDVREEGKENAFSLGQSLWIGDEEFEDLDEIVARYINPMAGHARDLYAFRYFRDLGIPPENWAPGKEREKADELIKEDKRRNPSKIHYFVSASREYPGKFMLSYLPRTSTKHEFITVTPEGFRFRGQIHDSLAALFRWFKEHFREPIPGTPRTGSHHASGSHSSSRTPGGSFPAGSTPNVNPETLQRVAQSIPSHMLHSLSQAAHFGTPTGFGYPANTPYTPSGQTPFMTPFATTPHQPQTPRISGTPAPPATPSQTGVFRTPAAPAAPRGYGAQSYGSSYNRTPSGTSNQSSTPGNPRSTPTGNSSSADWGLGADASSWSTSNGAKSTSRSAGGPEPDDWKAASDAWAASSNRAKGSASNARGGRTSATDDWGASPSAGSARSKPNSQAGADDLRSRASAWASGAPNRAAAAPPRTASTSSASDDWGITPDPAIVVSNPAADPWAPTGSTGAKTSTTTSSTSAADDWGTSGSASASDPWGTSSSASASDPWAPTPPASRGAGRTTPAGSSKPTDDWGSSSSSRPSGGRGGGGGSRACYKCNQEGHMSRDCPNPSSGGGGGSRACYKCNQEGHMSRDCPNGSNGAGGGGASSRACYKCNKEGHMSRDCPNAGGSGGGGGGSSRACFKCNQEGHMSRDCPNSGGDRDRSNRSSSSSRPSSRPSGGAPPPAASNDDWGITADPEIVVNNSAADPWGSSSTSTKKTSSSNKAASDDWGTPSSAPSTPKASSSSTNKAADDWGDSADAWNATSSSSAKDDPWAPTTSSSRSRTATPSSNKADDLGSSSSSRAATSGSSRACYKCNKEGHMARDCPNASGGGGGGGRTCYHCNQEGHMARDCPNQGSRGGRSGGRSGGGSSGSSPWATGANAAPRGTGRSTPSSNNKSVNDDWGLSGSDLASSTGATGSASDPWGTSTKSSKSLDDWGSSSRSVSSRSGRSTAVAPPSSFSSESWDSEAPIKAASSDTADPWGDEPPGTTPRSSSGRRNSPKATEMGDATPLYDE